jgi:hypothetical protein
MMIEIENADKANGDYANITKNEISGEQSVTIVAIIHHFFYR